MELKSKFSYKLNIYVSIFVILYEFDQAMNSAFVIKDKKRNPVSEMAAYVLTVGMILRVVVFFLSIVHKPFYKLNLVIDRIIILAYLISGQNSDNTIFLIIVVIRPLVLYSTLKFTLAVTFIGYVMLFLALFSISKDDKDLAQ